MTSEIKHSYSVCALYHHRFTYRCSLRLKMRKDRRCLYITAYLKCAPSLLCVAGICQPDCCCTSQGTGAEFWTNYSRLFKQTETDMVSQEEGFYLAHLLYLWFFFFSPSFSSCLITTKKHQIGLKIIKLLKWTTVQVLRFYYCYPASSRILVLGQLSDAVNRLFGLCQVVQE